MRCVWLILGVFLLGAVACGAAGYFLVYRPALEHARHELAASRTDALEYRTSNEAITRKLDTSLRIIDGSQSIIDGAVGTLREAIEAVRRCRVVLLDLKRALQGP